MKKRLLLTVVLLSALLAVLSTGCKKVAIDCDYVITPYLQTEKDAARLVAENVVAYAFYADTAEWVVRSYDDAVAGIIRQRYGESTMAPKFSAEQDEWGVLTLGPMTKKRLMLVVCDRENRIYAWRSADAAEDMQRIVVNLMFCPWRTESRYVASKWIMVNETPPLPPPPPQPSPQE